MPTAAELDAAKTQLGLPADYTGASQVPTRSPEELAQARAQLGIDSDPNALDTSGMDAQFAAQHQPPSNTSATQDALARHNRLLGVGVSGDFLLPDLRTHEGYLQANQEPGIPLDQDTGAGALTRLALGVHRNRMDQLDTLRKMHGDENVRLDTEGNFIVRERNPTTGAQKDVLVDERNLTLRDLLDVTSELPALALSMATTKGVPAKSILEGSLKAAAGYFAGGVAEDAVASAGATGPDTNEILTHRGGEAVGNSVFGYGIGKLIHGVGSLAQMAHVAASDAADKLTTSAAMAEVQAGRVATEARFGIRQEPTLAELTGNPMAIRLETFLSNIPIARKYILKAWARQAENERAIQNAFFGGEQPNAAGTGQSLIDLLGGEVAGAETKAVNAAGAVREQGTSALVQPLEGIAGKPLSNASYGSRMLTRTEAQLQSFKARSREKFSAAKSAPDANEPRFDTVPIKDVVHAIQSNDLVKDFSGRPVLQPTGLNATLQDIRKLPENASYFDLVKLRSAIYDRVDSPEPITSEASRLLKKVGAAVTSEMGNAKLYLSSDTYALIQDANQFYKDNVESFYQKGIVEMLKPRTERGAVDPELIASRLIAGGKGSVTAYKTIADFFEKPQAVADMNRLLRDHVLESGTDTATGQIKLEHLAASVAKMEPEIVQALFGASKADLMRVAQNTQLALSAGNVGSKVPIRSSGDAVDVDALRGLLDSGKFNALSLQKLVARNNELRTLYGNQVFAAVKRNDFGIIEASPESFVKQFLLNPAIKASDVERVMQSIYSAGDSTLISDVRRVYLAQTFENSAKLAKGDVMQTLARIKGSPLRNLDPQKFALELEDPAVRQRMTTILGHDSFQALQDFATSLGGRVPKDAAGGLTGALKGGSLFDKIFSENGLGALSEMPKFIGMAWLMTNPMGLKSIMAAAKISPAKVALATRAALLTPEFMHVLIMDSASPDEARKNIEELKALARKKP